MLGKGDWSDEGKLAAACCTNVKSGEIMKLVLHHAPRACSMVTLMTLYEAGADFELRPINTRSGVTRSAKYLRMNHKGKVPALDIDARTLTENIAILAWIAKAFPAKKLMPADEEGWFRALS